MHDTVMQERIQLVVGDITRLAADAIVTSANESLMGAGGGVDGAVHKAAGPGLRAEAETLGGCPEGEARITGGYNLPAKHVIHAVGPIYQGGNYGEAGVLASAYRAALALAREHNLETLAFPTLSTGAYEYPREEACEIAVATVEAWLAAEDLPQTVIFCCYDPEDVEEYQTRLRCTASTLA